MMQEIGQLTIRTGWIISLIGDFSDPTSSELAELLDLDDKGRHALVEQLRKLRELGLVQRQDRCRPRAPRRFRTPLTRDQLRARYRYELTPAGRDALDAMRKLIR